MYCFHIGRDIHSTTFLVTAGLSAMHNAGIAFTDASFLVFHIAVALRYSDQSKFGRGERTIWYRPATVHL